MCENFETNIAYIALSNCDKIEQKIDINDYLQDNTIQKEIKSGKKVLLCENKGILIPVN